MKYVVVSLYDGTHNVEVDLGGEAFEGMDRIESDLAIVWRGEETMIVHLKESK